jgi:hypothetical protein
VTATGTAPAAGELVTNRTSTSTDPGNPSIILSEKKGTIIIENR